MLHETAVAWLTNRLSVTTPTKAWEETAEAFGTHLKAATDYVNDHYNLDNLQKELPERLVMLSNQRGGRIGK